MSEKFYLTKNLPPYVFSAIHHLKLEAIEKGIEVIDFGMGNPDSAPPKHVMEKLSKLSKDPTLFGYSVTGGIDDLKIAFCDYYKRRFNVDLNYKSEALVTIGAKEGIASLATAISDPDSLICVPSPSYPIHTFAFIISKSNVEHIEAIKPWDFLEKFKKFIDENSQKKNAKKVKAVIVNYPCNPTAEVASLEFYKELVDFCRIHKIYIISDIAYSELYYDKKDKPHSILEVQDAKDIAIEFSSVSKSYSMAGCRVGFAAGNQDLISALYKIKSYLDYGSFNPLQQVAAIALTSKSDKYLEDLRKLYKERAEFLVKLLKAELGWEVDSPKGSMFIWTKLPSKFSHFTSFEFCKKLILEAGVAISPGSAFGNNGEGYVRFSLIHGQSSMEEAVKRLKKIFEI
jgi:alanine-synthesizing transaminase